MSPAPEPVVGPAQDCLVLLQSAPGERPGTVFKLGKSPCSIGRSSDNDIVLEEERVSRKHATLLRVDGGWEITDAGSRHGTWIEHVRIAEPVLLASGTRFHIGASIFKFLSGDDVESASHEEVYRSTISDALTCLANRRKLEEE